ncbi:sushi domain-containing protein 4-like [Stigmatopora argus]
MCNGKTEATSQVDFKWSVYFSLSLAVVATGQRSGCLRPVMVEHGSPNVPETNIGYFPEGTLLEYHCDSGYLIDGPSVLTCTAFGHWSSEPPQCIHSDVCQPLHLPKNGGYTCHPSPCHRLSHGTVIEFYCNEGYILKGDYKYLTCQYGEWDGPVQISCVKEQACLPISTPENGGYTCHPSPCRVFSHGTVIEFFCHPGFVLDGDYKYLTCQDGQWDSSMQIGCLKQGCMRPFTEQHLSSNLTDTNIGTFPVGAVLQYRCDPGYQLAGPTIISCTASGHWSSEPPHCLRTNVCQPPYEPENGGYTCHPYPCGRLTHGIVIEYYCNEGYILKGDYKYLTCQYGTWDDHMQIRCVMEQGHNASLPLGMPTLSIVSSTASSVALILLLVVLFVLLQPKLKSLHRRDEGVSGHPVSILVEGVQVTLPSYEDAVRNNASAPSSESRVPIVLSEEQPRATTPEAGPSRATSSKRLHSETAVAHPFPPSPSSSSSSSWTQEHADTTARSPEDQHGLPLVDSEVDCSDDMPLLKET